MTRRTTVGFVIVEAADSFEQTLALDVGPQLPNGGILNWRDRGAAFLFKTRADARAAIKRTEHYRLAFSSGHPEARFCRIVPIHAHRDGDAP